MFHSAKLVAHRRATLVSRQQLARYESPEPEGRWNPVKHSLIVDLMHQLLRVRQVLDLAFERKYLDDNPHEWVSLQEATMPDIDPLSFEEQATFLETLRSQFHPNREPVNFFYRGASDWPESIRANRSSMGLRGSEGKCIVDPPRISARQINKPQDDTPPARRDNAAAGERGHRGSVSDGSGSYRRPIRLSE